MIMATGSLFAKVIAVRKLWISPQTCARRLADCQWQSMIWQIQIRTEPDSPNCGPVEWSSLQANGRDSRALNTALQEPATPD